MVCNASSQRRLVVLALFAVLTLVVTPFIGPQWLDWQQIFGITAKISSSPDADIFWRLRVPRTLAGFLAGMSLGLCGMAYQALFRNPLATPYTLGVAGGAALGAAMYVQLGLSFMVLGLSGGMVCALIGAMSVTLGIHALSCTRQNQSGMVLLLAGVALSFFTSSLLMFVQYVSDASSAYRIIRWLMGGLDSMHLRQTLVLLPVACTGSALLVRLAPELDLLACGPELAASRGLAVRRTRAVLLFVTSLLVAWVVALCGPIGFVGMMAPHICRLWLGSGHRALAPATLLFGGSFLCLCDALARVLIAPAEMPVGIITALLGGPFFIWLLFKK